MSKFIAIFLISLTTVVLFQNCESSDQEMGGSQGEFMLGDELVKEVPVSSSAQAIEFELLASNGALDPSIYNMSLADGMVKKGIQRVYSSEVKSNGQVIQLQQSAGGEVLGCLRGDVLRQLQELVVDEKICQFTRVDSDEVVCTMVYTPSLADLVFDKNIYSLRDRNCGQRFDFCAEDHAEFVELMSSIKNDLMAVVTSCD